MSVMSVLIQMKKNPLFTSVFTLAQEEGEAAIFSKEIGSCI